MNKMNQQKKIVLIFGGKSSEHEVSLNSAKNIYKAINKADYQVFLIGISKEGTWYMLTESQFSQALSILDNQFDSSQCVALISMYGKPILIEIESNLKTQIDCAFPIVHGTNGEDGTLQGLLRMVNIPFVGCDVLGSALCMDKEYAKLVMTAAHVPNSNFLVLRKNQAMSFSEISFKLGLPFFIKPANAGSSVGVHKIKSESDYDRLIKDSFLYDHKVIAEEYIQGQEIECAVKGLNHNPQASVAGELVVKHEFYSYEAKYLDDNGAEIVIPARISNDKMNEIKQSALRAYQVLNCDGLARVDFFLQADGKLVVNEINTLPGFTKISMYPKMWEASGLKYSDLISDLIQSAFDKFELDSTKKQNYVVN